MLLLYNGKLLHEEELRLPLSNRAFQYNDGFFETIIVQNEKLRFWQDHQARMQEAAQALKLQLPGQLLQPQLEEELLKLAQQNNAVAHGRLKIKIWRGGAGIYTPETNMAAWIATVHPSQPPAASPLKVGICQSVRTSYSPLSHFKGPNSLLYVLAGTEKKELGLDDLILLNEEDMVAELISSNLFWVRHGVLYTPALHTGCINGIMRRNILRWCASDGIKVQEVNYDAVMLQEADHVFSGNVTGIRSLVQLNGIALSMDNNLVDAIKSALAI